MHTRKKTLFHQGASSITRLFNNDKVVYVCPLCLTAHDSTSLDAGQLTIEHVPPASIGGKPIVLTCRTCNSTAGHTIDAHVARKRDLGAFLNAFAGKGRFSARIHLESSGTMTNARATFADGNVNLHIPSEVNAPTSVGALSRDLKRMVTDNTWDGHQLRLSPRTTYDPRLAGLSYLKSAYLAAFASLGYSYVLRKELEPVRSQIANPAEAIVMTYMMGLPSTRSAEDKIISVERPFRAIVIQFGRAMVFLPPVEQSRDFYDNLPTWLADARHGKLVGCEWPFPTRLDLQLDK